MHRLERLINLVATLLDAEQPITAEELHRRVPGYSSDLAAFRRAFERDKEVLRDLGVPVVLEPVAGSDPPREGYRIPKEAYYLDDPGLASDELAALHLAATAVHVEGASGVQALWKLGGEVAEDGPAPAVAALPGAEHLVTLFGAVSDRQVVRFAYRGKDRTLDPHRLSFRNGHWYVSGWDHDAGEDRSYRVDRIQSSVAVDPQRNAFERRPSAESPVRPWEIGGGEALTARLLVDSDQAGWAVGHVGTGAVVDRRPDGSVVLDVPVTNRDAFRSFVLGFLDHAEVLEPAELRDDLITWLEALCLA